MAQTIGDFFDQIGRGAEPSFSPEPWYNEAGDCIHYHWEPDEFYGDRVDDKLTPYRSVETKAIVGCQIKGITALLKKFGEFGLQLTEDGIPLAFFIVYSHITALVPVENVQGRRETYLYLLEKVGANRIELSCDDQNTVP